jgi:hypothetical protein
MSKASKTFKKKVRKDVMTRLASTLGDLEQAVGKNKFRKNLKKASKLLTADVRKIKLHADTVLQLPPVEEQAQ